MFDLFLSPGDHRYLGLGANAPRVLQRTAEMPNQLKFSAPLTLHPWRLNRRTQIARQVEVLTPPELVKLGDYPESDSMQRASWGILGALRARILGSPPR